MDFRKKLSQVVGFDWDRGNMVKNVQKHQVSCEEAEQVFFNRPLLLLDDKKHSRVEPRAKVFGRTNRERYLTVSFTIRDNLIRVISARPMNKREKKVYEKQAE